MLEDAELAFFRSGDPLPLQVRRTILHTGKTLGQDPADKIEHRGLGPKRTKPLYQGRPSVALGFSIHELLLGHPVHLDDFTLTLKGEVPMEGTMAPLEDQKGANCRRDLGSDIVDISTAVQDS